MYQNILAQNLFKGEKFKHPSMSARWYTCTNEPYMHEGKVMAPSTFNRGNGRNSIKSALLKFELPDQVTVWHD